jgi:outer membrane protein OmpA-like peptidoglycan-associated protein
MILGSDGRARVMALLEQVSTVEVGAEHFVKSGAKLNKSGEALLAPLVSKLTSSGLVVRIEGHTDSSGVAASNLLLSLKRARAAASWLMQQGVEPASIQVVGYGEMFPVDDPSSLANRRVILRLLSP